MADVDPFAARLEELKAQAPAGGDPFAARLAELQAAPAEGAQSNPVQASLVPKEEPGFIRRGLTQIGQGIGDIGQVVKDQVSRIPGLIRHPIESAKQSWSPEGLARSGAERRELERGVSDTLLGIPEDGARAVQNIAAMVAPQHVRPYATEEEQAQEARLAPGVRTVGHGVGMLLDNPINAATKTAEEVGGALATRFAPKVAAKVGDVVNTLRKIPGSSAVGGLASYEGTAPLAAAATAPSGHRMEAAGQAAADPMGVMIALGLGSLAPVRRGILGSEGGAKREYIEQHGEGAKVGPFTSGKGGVYNNQLAGLPAGDEGIGEASLRGARNIFGKIEPDFEAKHGYPYRGGPDLVQESEQAARDTNAHSQLDVTLAKEQRRAQVKQAKNEALTETAQRAQKLVGDFEAKRRVTASEPYEALKEQIRATPEGTAKQDATEVVKLMRKATQDLGTPHDVRMKLLGDLSLMEQFSDAPPPAEPPKPSQNLPALLKARETAQGPTAARLDQMIAAEMAPATPTGPKRAVRYMVPADQMNAFRKNLMEQARIGTTDAPRAHEAPLRGAAFAAKALVDKGPYAELNRQFAEATSKVEKARQGVGLKRKPGNDRAVEVENLAKRLRKGINDPTQIPNPSVAPEADVSPIRRKIAEAEGSAQPAIEEARLRNAAARAKVQGTKTKVAAGDEAAIPDRRMLGLNRKIGTEETDLNQLALRLRRENANTETAGASQADLEAFRAAHPDQATNTRLADLARNRLDLQFTLGLPTHGGIFRRLRTGAAHALTDNITPLMGRVAYGPAKKLDPAAIARALGAVRGATLGEKVKKAMELQKEQRQ